MEEAIKTLVQKIGKDNMSADDALKISQAVLNLKNSQAVKAVS